ncbi:MAG: DUF308 domain-containing protein [Anaerolineae bacterium]|jgi:uncharacterized membrane protein HdeD (DUF308 family)|nr:DUF308 domain-containing protein [Anaerolineae bacterium]
MYTKQMIDNWWLQLLRGALIALLGILVLVQPVQTAVTFVVIFGVFGVVNSIISLVAMISGFRQRYFWWLDLIFGLLSLGVGMLILRAPAMTLYFIVQLFSVIMIVSGIHNLITAVQLRKRMQQEWLLFATGAFKVLLALGLVLIPEAGLTAAMWVVGVLVVVLGVSEAVNAFRIRSLKKILDL